MGSPNRLVVPLEPHHITQRGNARRQVFYSKADHYLYLGYLKEQLTKNKVDLLAYCLMPNHVHLVVVPPDKPCLSDAIGDAHQRYAKSLNRALGSSGHIWQGRFYSCPLEWAHLYRAIRYVEMNPIRAGLCRDPYEYEWSSAKVHGGFAVLGAIPLTPLGDTWRGMDWTAYLLDQEAEWEAAQIRSCTALGKVWQGPIQLPTATSEDSEFSAAS